MSSYSAWNINEFLLRARSRARKLSAMLPDGMKVVVDKTDADTKNKCVVVFVKGDDEPMLPSLTFGSNENADKALTLVLRSLEYAGQKERG